MRFINSYTMQASPPVLHACAISCTRGYHTIFDAVDVLLQASQCLAIRGPNGAGKTSILRILAGFLPPSSGKIYLHGHKITPQSRGQNICYVGHQCGLKSDLTVLENVQFICSLLGKQYFPWHDVLEVIGLSKVCSIPTRCLSAGQRRRLALSRLWISPAKIWLIDEPFANLDAQATELIKNHLSTHLKKGGTACITAHSHQHVPTDATELWLSACG